MTATLFQLSAERLALLDRIADTGELSPEDEAAIAASEDDLRAKGADYIAVWRQLDAEAETMRAEARRLSDMASKRKRGAERVRERLAFCLDACKIDRLPTPLGTLRVQQASRPAITWDSAEDIPEEFRKVAVSLN